MLKAKIQARLETALEAWRAARASAPEILSTMQELLHAGAGDSVPSALWHECLRVTGKPDFILGLATPDLQSKWAEACFQAILGSGYTLRHMFEERVSSIPDKILFDDLSAAAPGRWSYQLVARRVREIAAVFHSIVSPLEPRAAIFSDNCVGGACCDLACLFYDVLNAPLNIHFDAGILAGIFDRLKINIVVTDTEERCRIVQEAARRIGAPLKVLALHSDLAGENAAVVSLDELCGRLGKAEITSRLQARRRFNLLEVATVMFTSGSTGEPKGVSFSNYNLVTKRFARAAALPSVGRDEVLLCYLPLFHTFGRYLEMLGTIYWGGTYVFAGNPSFATILSLLSKVQPTGLIGVPLRWAQLRDYCLEMQGPDSLARVREHEFRAVVGERLRWGLSAAGYLDPRVFHFFIRNGVDLCSGFGMTEATGGVTMTRPGQYVDGTHGAPLPGISARLSREGELQISGPYLGRYLDDRGPGQEIPPETAGPEYWLSTGDLFCALPNGYYQLVDRIKDIYKNDRGQTIAPLRVEKEFLGVPGIKRTFLVGDGRAYNVLLIVQDDQDPMLHASGFEENRREYFRRIVSAANRNVAPYERVVNFEILDRDFERAKGEITAKGSLNRKTIEANFTKRIEELYRTGGVDLRFDTFSVRIPRWFFRDLSILEDDISICDSGLRNNSTGGRLALKKSDGGKYLIGDLEYSVDAAVIDLGTFARQPRLWIGNPSLISFCPCKDGWDIPMAGVSHQALRPWKVERQYAPESMPRLPQIRDPALIARNHLVCCALFSHQEMALEAVQEIGRMLPEADLRWSDLLRRRLEALARHPAERIRCLAYRILLLDNPAPDYGNAFSLFVESGLNFLNQESIEAIANSRFEKPQLEALRRRLLRFRDELNWPADEITRNQFRDIFQLLVNFVGSHPDFYSSVRAELAMWSLHKTDPALADSARMCLLELRHRVELLAARPKTRFDRRFWDRRLVFEDEVTAPERRRLRKLLGADGFLSQSIMLACEEGALALEDVAEEGIWISRTSCAGHQRCYRLSVNAHTGKHFDLELTLGKDLKGKRAAETQLWWLAISGYPYGARVLPQPGCFHPKMRAFSSVYRSSLTVWEKIRQYSNLRGPSTAALTRHAWKKLFVPALAAFYRGWRSSGRRIVPGLVSPGNVLVPELDFHEGGTIASLAGWQDYRNPLSLVRPMVMNFFEKAAAHYPWCREQLDVSWIFDACLEAIGEEEGHEFLAKLRSRLAHEKLAVSGMFALAGVLDKYLETPGPYLTMHVHNAIERYREWKALNPVATASAREQTVEALYRLYPLYRYPEFVRYYFYRHTFYEGSAPEAALAFDRMLSRMMTDKEAPAMHLSELFDLREALGDEEREVFNRMVFPRMRSGRRMEFIRIDDAGHKEVIVSSYITDRFGAGYTFREPIEPREVGHLYRHFFNQNIPMAVSEQDRYYVLLDVQERVVGGICYQFQELQVAHIVGIVVSVALQARGAGSAMEEEFCSRMSSQGIRVVRGHFLERFYLKRGYQVNSRWGTLVKFLSPDYP